MANAEILTGTLSVTISNSGFSLKLVNIEMVEILATLRPKVAEYVYHAWVVFKLMF